MKSRTIIFVHEVIYTREPSYLFEKLQFIRSTRTKNIICIRHRFLLSNRQFFINAIRTWNELSNYIQETRSATLFNTKLLLKNSNSSLLEGILSYSNIATYPRNLFLSFFYFD